MTCLDMLTSRCTMLDYGRELCGDVAVAGRREWLVTNGLGGYAMGTVAGMLSRSYHGLLIAAMAPPGAPGLPPAARTLLLAKLDETADYDGRRYELYTDQRADEPNAADPWITPKGYRHLERFHLEGTTPVWTYAVADARLEKRVWMEPGANTTYIQYTLVCRRAGGRPVLTLHLPPWSPTATTTATWPTAGRSPSRSSRSSTACGWRPWTRRPSTCSARARMPLRTPPPTGNPTIRCSSSAVVSPPRPPGSPATTWPWSATAARRTWRATATRPISPSRCRRARAVTIVASTEAAPGLDGAAAYARRQAYEQALLAQARPGLNLEAAAGGPDWLAGAVEHLALAADQFIVARQQPDGSPGRSVIAGYPWFGDWGRDTMIALPGLTLVTGRAAGGAADPADLRPLRRPGHAAQPLPRRRRGAGVQHHRRHAVVFRGHPGLPRGHGRRQPAGRALPGLAGDRGLAPPTARATTSGWTRPTGCSTAARRRCSSPGWTPSWTTGW